MKQAAIGIIFSKDKQSVLLVQRRDLPLWVLPGGGLDCDETAEQAVIREVAEETGLTVHIKRKAAEYTPINWLSSITHVFECDTIDFPPMLQPQAESRAIQFFPINALPTSLFFAHYHWIHEILQSKQSLVKRPLVEFTFLNAFFYILQHPLVSLRYIMARFMKLTWNY